MTTETGRPSGSTLAEKSMGSAVEAWTKMKPLVLSAALASAIIGAGSTYVEIRLGILPHGATIADMLVSLLRIPLQALVSAPLAVAIHRLILLGEITPGVISLCRRYHWAFFVWLCMMTFLGNVVGDVTRFTGDKILWLLVIPVVFLTIKFALVFPAVAIGSSYDGWRSRLQTSWRQMDGNFWLFFRAMLFVIMAMFFISLIPAVILTGIFVSVFGKTGNERILEAGFIGFLNPAVVMTAAAVASWLYASVRDNKPV